MSAAEDPAQPSEYAGSVDVFDAEIGIRGWAADPQDPAATSTIRLVVAGVELGSVETGDSRPDVAEALGFDADTVGYAFPPEIFDAFLALPDIYAAARPEVFVENAASPLPGPSELPLVARCKSLALRRGRPDAEADPFADIAGTLELLATEAYVLSLEPKPETSEAIGYVEAYRRLDPDTFVVFGWVGSGVPQSGPAWVTQGSERPAGLLLSTYTREDLPDGAAAFVGLLRTGWAPDPGDGGFQISLRGATGAMTLASIAAIAQPEPHQAVAWIESIVAERETHGTLDAICAFVQAEAGRPVVSLTGKLDCAIDRVLLLPGFGLFVRGWMLIGPKRPADMMLLAGNAVARAQMATMMRYPRPDLTQHFPKAANEAGTAGFTCFLRGPVELPHLTDVSLRIGFDDATRVVAPVELHQIEVLRQMDSVLRLQEFYPQIQSEPFFGRMRTALVEAIRQGLTCEVIAAASTSARPSLCLDLGAWPEEIQLLLDRLFQTASLWPRGARLVLLLNHATPRTRVQAWAGAIRAAGIDVALVHVGEAHGILHLRSLHDVLPFTRFVYLKPGAVPIDPGWTRIRAWLAGENGQGPSCLAASGSAEAPAVEHRLAGLMWEADAFLDWAADADIRFSQDYLNLLVDQAGATVEGGTAYAIPRVAPSAFLRRMDATDTGRANR